VPSLAQPPDEPVSSAFKAKYAGRCAVCGRRFGKGIRVVWLTGSGPCHEQCAPTYPEAGGE
jgi:hypothetical protein